MRIKLGSSRRWRSLVVALTIALVGGSVQGGAAAERAVAASPALAALADQNQLISNIGLSPSTPNILPLGSNVTLNFSYTTNEPGGVRIFARPFTGGAPTPGYGASGSPLYATGSGVGSGTFTILSGPAVVERIRFQMLSADQSRVLFQAFIPVHYEFTAATSRVQSIVLSPATPNILPLGSNVTHNFSYVTDEPGGVRIFARPFTNGALTPGYGASGSPLYATGSGVGSGTFTILSGPSVVDQIRFQIYSSDQSRLLGEFFLPVHYEFTATTSRVQSIVLSPATPNILPLGSDVTLNFSYVTDEPGGVRIFARPFTNGALTPGYGASGSGLYATGSGVGSGTFRIIADPAVVDQIRFQVLSADQSRLLGEFFVPVYYQFGALAFSPNVTYLPSVTRH